VSFEEGLERTVEWYLEKHDWVEGVVTGEYQKVYGTSYKAGRVKTHEEVFGNEEMRQTQPTPSTQNLEVVR